jgi:hypothetical protein
MPRKRPCEGLDFDRAQASNGVLAAARSAFSIQPTIPGQSWSLVCQRHRLRTLGRPRHLRSSCHQSRSRRGHPQAIVTSAKEHERSGCFVQDDPNDAPECGGEVQQPIQQLAPNGGVSRRTPANAMGRWPAQMALSGTLADRSKETGGQGVAGSNPVSPTV